MSNNSVLLPSTSSLQYKMLLVESGDFRSVATEMAEFCLKAKAKNFAMPCVEAMARTPITSKSVLCRASIMDMIPAAIEISAMLNKQELQEQAAKALYVLMEFINSALEVIAEAESQTAPNEVDEDEW